MDGLAWDSAFHLMLEVKLAGPEDLDALLASEPLGGAVQDAQEMMRRYGTTVTVMTGGDL